MALHRDIYWVGRQWAVTGYGIQACNQKQKAKFDIEGSRLWEEGVLESIRAEKWLNVEDFDKAIEVARKYYPEPPRKAAPIRKAAPRRESARAGTASKEAGSQAPVLEQAVSGKPVSQEAKSKESPVEPPKPEVHKFDMQVEGWPAKFLSQWRIRIRR